MDGAQKLLRVFNLFAKKIKVAPLRAFSMENLERRFFTPSPPVIAKIAARDLSIACDEVLFHNYYLTEHTKTFKELKAYCIGIHCDLEELIRRKQKRGGYSVGLGRDQINKIHGPTRFNDLEVDTTYIPSADCAKQILEFITANPKPQGFKKLEEIFKV